MEPAEKILAKNLNLFNEMKDLAEKQKNLLSEDDIRAFFELSSRRERLQEKITADERDYKQLTTKNPGISRLKNEGHFASEITEAIKSIQDIDKKIESFILDKRDMLSREINDVRKGRKAVKGYGPKGGGNPHYINRQG